MSDLGSGTSPDPSARAQSWVAHLRDGGTTTWAQWVPSDSPSARSPEIRPEDLPSAQQLELLRRVNVCGRPSEDLVRRLLEASTPGRGLQERGLVGGPEQRFGPAPIDPAETATSELIALGSSVLADLSLAHHQRHRHAEDHPGVPTPFVQRVQRAVRRRLEKPSQTFRVGGMPLSADATRAELVAQGETLGGERPTVLLLGGPIHQVLAETWQWRVRRGVTAPWDWWVDHFHRKGALHPRADLADQARFWAERVGAEQVQVVLDPGAIRTLTEHAAPTPTLLSGAGSEVLRHTNSVLRLLVPEAEHRWVVDDVLVPWLAEAEGGRSRVDGADQPVIPEQHRDWARARAERLATQLSAEGYPIHGDLATLTEVVPAAIAAVQPDLDAEEQALAVLVCTLVLAGDAR